MKLHWLIVKQEQKDALVEALILTALRESNDGLTCDQITFQIKSRFGLSVSHESIREHLYRLGREEKIQARHHHAGLGPYPFPSVWSVRTDHI